MTLSVLDEGEINAAIAVPVQVQGRLRPSSFQRRLLRPVRALRAEVAEPRFLGPVIADRRCEVALAAEALVDIGRSSPASSPGHQSCQSRSRNAMSPAASTDSAKGVFRKNK